MNYEGNAPRRRAAVVWKTLWSAAMLLPLMLLSVPSLAFSPAASSTTSTSSMPAVTRHASAEALPQAQMAASTQAAPPTRETITIGYSVQGRPIEAFRMGSGPRSVVIAGAIHGNESNSGVLTRDLMAHFDANLHLFPAEVSLYFIPAINPDGLAAGTRRNANNVDLNRNWDTRNWQTDTYDSSGRVPGGGGPAPFSEPETAALSQWLINMRDQSSTLTVLFYHSAYPPAGLVLGGSVGAPITPAFADIIGYPTPAPSRPGWSAYPVTGLAPVWCGENGIECFEIELPSRANLSFEQTQRHMMAVLSVLMWRQTWPNQRCFLETGFCISGRIREFWEQNNGLVVFGLPLSPPQEQLIDGVPRQVQWFERNRLELHPQNAPPYDVLIGRIGVDRLEQQGRNWWTFAKGDPASAGQGCTFFEDTQHSVCGEILAAWRASGLELGHPGVSEAESLALFGMPISEAQTETLPDGQQRTVQWFERARFEVHPEQQPPFNVLLGLLGNEMQQPAVEQASP